MIIFTILAVLIYKPWPSPHFLVYSAISFFRNLKVLFYRSFTSDMFYFLWGWTWLVCPISLNLLHLLKSSDRTWAADPERFWMSWPHVHNWESKNNKYVHQQRVHLLTSMNKVKLILKRPISHMILYSVRLATPTITGALENTAILLSFCIVGINEE